MTSTASSLEAILFAAGDPVPASRISLILNVPEEEVFQAAEELSSVLEKENHGICLVRMEAKFQLCSAPEYAGAVTRILEQRRPPMLSPAALETLAVVAYYQPATSAYISKVRGVDSSYSIGSLTDKGLIESKGKLEAPGRPTLYGTTDLFLRTMQISNLSELPPLPDMASTEGIEKLQKAIDALTDKDVPAPETEEKPQQSEEEPSGKGESEV